MSMYEQSGRPSLDGLIVFHLNRTGGSRLKTWLLTHVLVRA